MWLILFEVWTWRKFGSYNAIDFYIPCTLDHSHRSIITIWDASRLWSFFLLSRHVVIYNILVDKWELNNSLHAFLFGPKGGCSKSEVVSLAYSLLTGTFWFLNMLRFDSRSFMMLSSMWLILFEVWTRRKFGSYNAIDFYIPYTLGHSHRSIIAIWEASRLWSFFLLSRQVVVYNILVNKRELDNSPDAFLFGPKDGCSKSEVGSLAYSLLTRTFWFLNVLRFWFLQPYDVIKHVTDSFWSMDTKKIGLI